MTTNIHNFFQRLLLQWLETGAAPETPVEGIAPEYANVLAARPEEWTFDTLFHSAEAPDWSWKSIEFHDVFDGQFFFYVPVAWSEMRQKGPQAIFGDTTATRQSLFLVQKSLWHPRMSAFLEEVNIVAFAYYLLHKPEYHQWVFVTEANDEGLMWAYAVYSAGDWLVVVKGDASTAADLQLQLTSLINSNPWYGWIEAAQARQQ